MGALDGIGRMPRTSPPKKIKEPENKQQGCATCRLAPALRRHCKDSSDFTAESYSRDTDQAAESPLFSRIRYRNGVLHRLNKTPKRRSGRVVFLPCLRLSRQCTDAVLNECLATKP